MAIFDQGVGLAAEYNSQGRQQSQAREAAQRREEEEEQRSRSSSITLQQHEPTETRAELPPTYAASVQGSERGEEAPNTENVALEPHEGDSDFDSDTSTLYEDDEGDWELDDLEREDFITPPESPSGRTADIPTYEESVASDDRENVDQLVYEVVATSKKAGVTSKSTVSLNADSTQTHRPLPFPVILPQRRPRKKSRGFVRAYAPVLNDCGIDQATFLSFLKNLHKASQASPIFPVIQISAAIAGFSPSLIAMAVTTAVQVAAQAGEEIQSHARMNDFLERMNEELFKSHGLYAMIVKYKSDAEIEEKARSGQSLLSSLIKAQQVDLSTNQIIANYTRTTSGQSSGSGSHGLNEKFVKLRLASDTTNGVFELPEAAPLLFPDLDFQLEHAGPEKFKDKTKDAKEFLADYLDRRAQMRYATQDPNSSLALSESQRGFASELAEPSHPMDSNGRVGLLSGGKFTPRDSKLEQLRERRMEKDARRIQRGRNLQSKREGKRARQYGDGYLDELATRTGGRGFGARGGLLGQLAGAASGNRGHSSALTVQAHKNEKRYADSASSRPHDVNAGQSEHISSGAAYGQRRLGRRGRGGPGGAVRRLMQEDVLYLMVVNLPSESELEEARQELRMARS